MTTSKFQARLFKETGKFFRVQHIYYLERKGVFTVPRVNGRRDFSTVYREVYEKIMEFYSKKYGWLGITRGELTDDKVQQGG